MRFQIFVLLFLIITLKSDLIDAEYVSIDDPKCTSGCSALSDINARTICYQDQLNFYNYKLVKSIFNFGKASIYAGLWINRYDKPDSTLFQSIFNDVLKKYNTNSNYLGNLKYDSLDKIASSIFQKTLAYSNGSITVAYDQYPSLKCPTPCTYELVTWKTLAGISIGIFVLALITTAIYSIYLHKQFSILRTRIKSIKYTKIIS